MLTPAVMEILDHDLTSIRTSACPTISNALHQLAQKEKYLALEMNDYRYNVGVKYGLLNAQLALALSGKDRDEVIAMLMEMLLLREHHAGERRQGMSVLTAIITAEDQRHPRSGAGCVLPVGVTRAIAAECRSLEDFRTRAESVRTGAGAVLSLCNSPLSHPAQARAVVCAGLIPFERIRRSPPPSFRGSNSAIPRSCSARTGPDDGISSALAAAYRSLGFQTLANQVRASVRSVRGNQWMFRAGHPSDHPLRVVPVTAPENGADCFPLLHERTPVRMDLSHSGWSDIFFLGMDFPEGARVLNISIDLAVRERWCITEAPSSRRGILQNHRLRR